MKYFLITLSLLTLGQTLNAADPATITAYNRSCIACHSSGVAGAPRSFQAKDWESRLAKGMPVLLENTINGINAMPAKGLCQTCSEEDFEALINYMSTPK